MPLSDRYRTALVTGAGSGLGAAFVKMLLAEGVHVWGTSRSPATLPVRPGFTSVRLELADPASVDAAWAASEQAAGGVDLLVNNAGAGVFGPESSLSETERDEQRAVLLDGPMRLARLAAAAMRTRGRGAIVNVTSLAVELPVPFMTLYNVHKSALADFTAHLAIETAVSGLVVVELRPGDYRTNFNRAMHVRRGSVDWSGPAARVWTRLERIMAAAPQPERAARDLRCALMRRRSGIVRSGSFFQARVAPWGNRLLPARMMRWLRGFYFGSTDS